MLASHIEVVSAYFSWTTLPLPSLNVYADPKDWLVRKGSDGIDINTRITSSVSPELFRLLVIKALVHVTHHGLADLIDITALRRGFGDTTALMLDIEADLHTAVYFHHVRGYGMELLYDILLENIPAVHATSLTRDLRFERFLGSLLSVWWYYEHEELLLMVPALTAHAERNAVGLLIHEPLYSRYRELYLGSYHRGRLKDISQGRGRAKEVCQLIGEVAVSLGRVR